MLDTSGGYLFTNSIVILLVIILPLLQGGREISAITVTEDYLCSKEAKIPHNFFLILIFNELFKFKISDEPFSEL